MSDSGPLPLPPPLPASSMPEPERPSATWNRPEDIIPERKSRTGIGRAAPGHFTIHPEDWESPIFRDAVVPDEDNPMRGWRRFGADLLHAELWPAVARVNPVLAYLTGRRRGAAVEDFLGFVPWIAFGLWHAGLLLFSSPTAALGIIAVELAVLPVGVAACAAYFAGMQIRGAMRHLPLDELMTTPIKPENIVQGLTIRPMAVQAAAALAYVALHAIPFGILGAFPALVFLPLAAMLAKVAVETGGAFGARAHFCIREASTANLRAVLDLMRLLLLRVCLPMLLLAVGLATFGGCFVIPIMVIAIVLLFMPWVPYRWLRKDAIAAMQWTCEHPEEWWANELNEHDRLVRERGLFTRWDHLVDVTPPQYRQPMPPKKPSIRS